MMQAAGMPTLRTSRSVGQPILWWCPRKANLGWPPGYIFAGCSRRNRFFLQSGGGPYMLRQSAEIAGAHAKSTNCWCGSACTTPRRLRKVNLLLVFVCSEEEVVGRVGHELSLTYRAGRSGNSSSRGI